MSTFWRDQGICSECFTKWLAAMAEGERALRKADEAEKPLVALLYQDLLRTIRASCTHTQTSLWGRVKDFFTRPPTVKL